VKQFEREVSSSDRGFVARDALRPPTVIQLVLEGNGNPTPDALREALRRTSNANPGSCLVLDESGSVLMWRSGPPPELTVVSAPEFEALDNRDAPFLQSGLNVRTGPSCSLLLVRGKTNTYLVFRALHAVMDGQGVLGWAQDFVKCLRGEEPSGHQSTMTVDQFLREMAAPRRPSSPPDALHPFGPANPVGATGRFHWRRLTTDRPLDAKVSGRIGVALANRARARGEEGAFRLALPADLRHYRPGERTTGNFFGGMHIEVPPGAEADEVSLRIVLALYTHESIKPLGLYAGEYVASLAAMQVRIYFELAHLDDTGRYHASATLSNLGVLKSADLSAPSFRVTSAFFVPLEGDSGCTVTLNGYDQRTEVTVGLSDRFARGVQLDAFVDLVRLALEAQAKPKPETVARKYEVLPSVSETAILTLRARAEEHERSDRLFADPEAADWFRRVAWPPTLDRWWASNKGGRGLAFRADAIDHVVAQYHSSVASLAVTELGCGLSTREKRLSHLPFAGWMDVDLPEMVELRRTLGATGAHLAASVLDFAWMDQVHGDPSHQLFIAEGLLYYLERAEVAALFSELRRRFPGAAIVFDVIGANDVAMLLENTKSAGAPIAWHLEGDYADALRTFGLGVIGELTPDRVMQDAIGRYWHRFTPAEQVANYFVMHSAALMRGRSGVVLGRFG